MLRWHLLGTAGIEKLNRQRSYPKGALGIVQKTRLGPEKLQYKEAQMKRKESPIQGKGHDLQQVCHAV